LQPEACSETRLLLVLPTDGHGGCEYNALSFAKFAAEVIGLRVALALPLHSRTAFLQEIACRNGIECLDLGTHLDQDDDQARLEVQQRCMRSLLARWQPDAVFVAMPWPARGGGIAAACAIADVPCLVKFALVSEELYLPWPQLKRFWQEISPSRQIRFANSNWSARLLERHFALPAGAIDAFHVGPIGLRDLLPTARHLEDRAVCRAGVLAEFGLPGESVLVTTIGRLSEQKGYPAWLKAAARLAQRYPDLVFLWVGDGELREALAARIRGVGLSARIVLTGFRPDARRLLRASDVFVLPTLFEGGCSQALLEAMEEGVPAVVSRIGAMEEVVGDGEHVLLARPGDAGDLVRQTRRLIEDADLRSRLREAARRRAACFSRDLMFARTLSRLDRLLGTCHAAHAALAHVDPEAAVPRVSRPPPGPIAKIRDILLRQH